jgi:hypothetical protein
VKGTIMTQTATVIANSIYLHDVPAGKKIGTVAKGDKLTILASEKRPQWTWYRVRKNTRTVGWLAGNPKWIKIDDPIPDVKPVPAPEPYDYTAMWIAGGLLVAGLAALFLGGWLP